MQEGVCWQQARLNLSVCPTNWTFLTAGQAFLLLPRCMSVHISLVSLPPTPFIYACLLCALLLCNKFVADCLRSPFPPLFFFPVFPTLCAPQETKPLLACVHLAVKLAEGPTCAWAHNKIIFALGCWNSADTPRQFHLSWKRGKKKGKIWHRHALPVIPYIIVVTVVMSCSMLPSWEGPQEKDNGGFCKDL